MDANTFKGLNVKYAARWQDPAIKGKGSFHPQYILLHHTAGVGTGVVPDVVNSSGKYRPIPKANFVIKRDGTIWVISKFKTYHAGLGKAYKNVARNDMNSWSYGIEVESLGKVQDFTPAQMNSIVALCNRLLAEMKMPVTNVINHKTWSSSGKVDTLYSDAYWQAKLVASNTPSTPSKPVVIQTVDKEPAMQYVYTGKPTKNQTLSTNYTKVTDGHYTPTRDGILFSDLYLHVDYKLKPGVATGKIRVRIVRDKKVDDPSAYQDYVVAAGDPDFLLTHVWFEKCEKGVPLIWEVKVDDGFASAVATTRYTKFYTV